MLMVKFMFAFTFTPVCCLLSSIAIATEPLFPDAPGMVSYTYRNEFAKDFSGTFNTTKSLGISDMEFFNLFGKTAEDIRIELDERGMVCSSFGVSYVDLQTKTNEVAENAKTHGAV